MSSLYQTEPVGGPDQGPYLNAVAVLDTDLGPRDLLEHCLAVERERGRVRRERWGPRTLDLDVLLVGPAVVDEPGLKVPHPALAARRFVLEPLLEAWPDAALPGGALLAGMLPAVAGQQVERAAAGAWWAPADPGDVLVSPPPDLTAAGAAEAARTLYGIDGTADAVAGERDRNFRIRTPAGDFLLKAANPAQDPVALAMQQDAIEHLAAADPGLAVPRVVRTLTGTTVGVQGAGGEGPAVTLQTFLGGDPVADGRSTPASRASLAALLARLDTALASFDHPAGDRHDPWELSRLGALRDRTGHLEAGLRAVVEDEIDRFVAETLPALAGLPRRMIHGDANPANLLADPDDPDRITGIVDFGDVGMGTAAAEVAVAAAYQCLGDGDPLAVVTGFADAYDRHVPLGSAGRALVPDLVAARLAQSLTISAWRASLHPANRAYILLHADAAAGTLLRIREGRR